MDLPLQSEVRVWRENGGWQGPFKIVAHDGQNVTLELPNGPATFRSTMVAPYHRSFNQDISGASNDYTSVKDADPSSIVVRPNPVPEALVQKKKGRPKGFRNRSSVTHQVATAHLSAKKVSDHELAIKLRKSGVIIAPGLPFEKSDNIKIIDFIARDIIAFKRYNPQKHEKSVPLFNSRIMHKIKDKNGKPYEKFRWVIQGYNDYNKQNILTQFPTIQRMSQRLIIAITITMMKQNYILELRDITQAYP
jgi:hypothetical protein